MRINPDQPSEIIRRFWIVFCILCGALVALEVVLFFATRAHATDRQTARGMEHKAGKVHSHHRAANMITISTAGGSITVAVSHADKFRGFIADIVARGYRGPINCYARGGHMRGSWHYDGEACDFAQRRRNQTVRLMYHVGDLATKWGLRDGCSFRHRDCGHIDTGARLARGYGRRLVARIR